MASHPDPETARIIDRNRRAYAEAVQAPPPEVADDPRAYLKWVRERPAAPVPRPRPLTAEPRPAALQRKPASLPRQREPRPPVRTAMELNAERNRQLNALRTQIEEEGGQIPDVSEPRQAPSAPPSADVSPETS